MVRLNISPQTHVRATQGDAILFRIPKEKRQPGSQKRVERLEKYNAYKEELRSVAKGKQFEIPECGAHIKFFIPVPKSWYHTKKAKFHMQPHQANPDIDYLCKAFCDSLLSEDKRIHNIQLSKFWVDNETGWIEIEFS